MPRSAVHWSGAGTNSRSFSNVDYIPACQDYFDIVSTSATEANVQTAVRTAGVMSKLRVSVSSNTLNAASTFSSRIGGAAGSMSISITASTTGDFVDSSNSDTLTAGNLYNYKSDLSGSSSGQIVYRSLQAVFVATTNTVSVIGAYGGVIRTTASTTWYDVVGGTQTGANTTLANAQQVVGFAATHKNMSVTCTTNTRASSSTSVGSMVNAGAGNLLVTVAASTTGLFEDTSNSDSLSVGDLIAIFTTTGTGTGSFIPTVTKTEIESTSGYSLVGYGHAGTAVLNTQPTVKYYPIGGALTTAITTESQVDQYVPVALTASYMRVYISANNCSGTSTWTLRVNGADSALSASITASTTGAFSDTSNTVDLSVGDRINYELTPVGAAVEGVRHRSASITMQDKSSGVRLLASTGVGV